MTKSRARRIDVRGVCGAALMLVALLPGCGGTESVLDSGTGECARDWDCDDGIFCNGVERCVAGGDASGNVCLSASAPCAVDRCQESARVCNADCDTADADGDGHDAVSCGGDDCDDTNAVVFPGALEVCDLDGVDEDCDPATLGGRDVDGDGAVDATCCNGTACGTDCDDARAGVNPFVPEVCDGFDNDCDGGSDEGLLVQLYVDADHDGVGTLGAQMLGCPGAPGLSAATGDCDDDSAATRPTAAEICDSADNDCDGVTDENTLAVPWYVDADGDGWGIATADALPQDSCAPLAGRAIRIGDCDDMSDDVNPTSRERCNGIDDDCNGRADFRIGVRDTEDDDLDGIPDERCELASADCDDRDPYTSTAASVEVCDARDNDCDGTVDEAAGAVSWYADVDGDRYGDMSSFISQCAIAYGRTLRGGDCNDDNASIHPSAIDACGTQPMVDDDCDGETDEGGTTLVFYADLDGDGYGVGTPLVACQADARTASRGGDCDDERAEVNPAALDDCASLAEVDDDCDGRTDETLTPRTFYTDADGDGYGTGAGMAGCEQPPGTATVSGDCNDASAARNPGVPDDCSTAVGVDDDCDVSVDEGRMLVSYYLDLDEDGYGAGSAMPACAAPTGTVLLNGDCDDNAAARNPGAPDDCSRTALVDDDCDGEVDEAASYTSYYRDTDGDAWGSGAAQTACSAPLGYVARNGDCDEALATRNPGRVDDCTALAGVDDDCDVDIDEGVTINTFYRDADGDGYGTPLLTTTGCVAPNGYVTSQTDCDDTQMNAHPGAMESAVTAMTCANGYDDDCDGSLDCADSACSSSTGCNSALTVTSGGNQSGVLHALLGMPTTVHLQDGGGAPIASRTITLRTSGATAASYTALTDASGNASFQVRAGLQLGAETLRFSSVGVPDVTTLVTNTAPAAGNLFTMYNGPHGSVPNHPAPGPAWDQRHDAAPTSLVSGPDGEVFLAVAQHIVRIRPNGATELFAGSSTIPGAGPWDEPTLAEGGHALSQSIAHGYAAVLAYDHVRRRVYIVPRNRWSVGCALYYIEVDTQIVHHVLGEFDTCVTEGDGGPASEATAANIYALAVNDAGVVYFIENVTSPNTYYIRYIDSGNTVRTILAGDTTYPGVGTLGFIPSFQGSLVPVPGSNDLYFSDNTQKIYRTNISGSSVQLVAGGGSSTADGVAATTARLLLDARFTATPDGQLWVADTFSDAIRRIDANGLIWTVAGTVGTTGDTGEGGPAASALLTDPTHISTYLGTHIAFIDAGSRSVRVIW